VLALPLTLNAQALLISWHAMRVTPVQNGCAAHLLIGRQSASDCAVQDGAVPARLAQRATGLRIESKLIAIQYS
jgi:hypothetical protein